MPVQTLLPNSLSGLSDEVLGCMELRQDPLFHKIPPERIPYYVHESLQAGRVAAATYKGLGIRGMCRDAGLRYEITESSVQFHNVSFRAQIDFSKKPPEIILYTSSLKGMRTVCQEILGERSSGSAADLDLLVDIHLAHEFYHWLEYREQIFTNEKLERIEVFKLGPYSRKSSVVQCCEIAAHAFCKELLGLPCLPNLLDYAYLIGEQQLATGDFMVQIETCKLWI
ncbi:hypothetical protein M3650_26300 [Paenibacillus sp. MER TA 81-3]|uniref:hypothetical protein n=1 Tax=Paenibacillus sp. MER TA 81-3 TaxID=2939573 RepID=UPI00203EFD9A|nr:hypothetical protein [Paenibacillus sp. MER TA 81-3]MCM3342040.1 hypothetical protein [Paenibacillus sp. MER TA 81-3]